jgi:hypothetical protein
MIPWVDLSICFVGMDNFHMQFLNQISIAGLTAPRCFGSLIKPPTEARRAFDTGSSYPFWSESGRSVDAGTAGPIVELQFADYRDRLAVKPVAEKNTK